MTTIYNLIDAWEFIDAQPDNSFDAIITDPMYFEAINIVEFVRVCRGNIIVFCDPKYRPFDIADEIHHWVKPQSTKNTSKKMSNFVEEILVIRRGSTYNTGLQWANYTGVWSDIIEGKIIHPFQKPLSLIERLMRVYTNPGDKVLDPFAGSGTTGQAGLNLGRDVVMCDNDVKYYDLWQVRGSGRVVK